MSVPKFYMRNVKSQLQHELVIVRIIHPLSNKEIRYFNKATSQILVLLVNINCQKMLLI